MGYELAEKGRLDEYLRQTRLTGNAVSNMSNYQVMKILVNIVEGLAHLHSRGIIHGNLQGKNLFLKLFLDRDLLAGVIYLTEENIPKIGKVCNNKIKIFKTLQIMHFDTNLAARVLIFIVSEISNILMLYCCKRCFCCLVTKTKKR